ncbi:hypothetical protein D3Y57_12055 [Sphingomonas paeninsulae]|uniref:Uncharacterized protein n=2 Tax=Sphingomonas paeninsulae TaxID=2319844 RepID=A0A494TQ78_SPHPE|nr:hypothetical protein D3Y57_12055 [Sphingomonas paeninsulae]
MLGFLRYVALGPAPDPHVDFGQSMGEDIRFMWRFRRCRRLSVEWRTPTQEEVSQIAADAILARFGDVTIAVGEVDGRRWIVRERDWHGWPDPPRYVFFAVDQSGAVWAARDFDWWPRGWPAM